MKNGSTTTTGGAPKLCRAVSSRIYYGNAYVLIFSLKKPNLCIYFFQIDVENLFLIVGKKLEINIDQKIYDLSIAAIFKAIRALLPCKPAKT